MRFFFGDECAEEVKSYKDIGKICDHWLLIKHCNNDVLLISSAQYISNVNKKGALNMIIGYLKFFCGHKVAEQQLTKINNRYYEIKIVAEELKGSQEIISKIIKIGDETSDRISNKILEIETEIFSLKGKVEALLKEQFIEGRNFFQRQA